MLSIAPESGFSGGIVEPELVIGRGPSSTQFGTLNNVTEKSVRSSNASRKSRLDFGRFFEDLRFWLRKLR
jgi:hypothetical protein